MRQISLTGANVRIGFGYDDLSCHVIPIILAKDFIYTNINVYRYLMGRPGQSYDQNVLKIYCIGDKMAVNQFVLSWIHRHEDMIEKEGTCRKWVNVYYQEIIKYEYGVMFFASYGQSKYYLAQWDAFVLAECPDFNPSISIKMYRSLPFPVFYCFARIAGLARDGYKVLFGK